MDNLIEILKKIDEYFDNINTPEKIEKFEKLLIECGYGRIKPGPLALDPDEVLTEEDMWIYKIDNEENYEKVSNEKIDLNTNYNEKYNIGNIENSNNIFNENIECNIA